jgi:hypothetical protein
MCLICFNNFIPDSKNDIIIILTSIFKISMDKKFLYLF